MNSRSILSLRKKIAQPDEVVDEGSGGGGGCISDITGVEWINAITGTPVGTSVAKFTSFSTDRPLGSGWSHVGVPIGDVCPDCELIWSGGPGEGGSGLAYQFIGGHVIVVPGLLGNSTVGGAIQEDTWTFTLTVNCPESGQTGVVGSLTYTVINQSDSRLKQCPEFIYV